MGLGRYFISSVDGAINQDLKALYFNEKIDIQYFCQWYSYNAEHIESLGSGSTVKGIRLEVLRSLKILGPLLPEQKKIADILPTVDEAIQNTKAQIEQTKELKKGLMQRLFSEGIGHTEFKERKLGRIPRVWEVVRLDDPISKVGSGVTPKGGSSSYLEVGIPMIRFQNVVNCLIKWDDMAYISQEQHDKMERSKLQPKDVLLNISGASAELSNINFAERLFSRYGINLYFYKNRKAVKFIRNFGKRAA